MLRISPFLTCAAVFGFSAFGQQEQTTLEVEALSSSSHKCWTSGSGEQYFQVCVSKHGNVVQFKSPAGIENIRLGEVGEGYVACASEAPAATATTYHDAGSTESGWAEPYTVTAAPVISRKTKDAKLELVQSFTNDAAERDFTITMRLYNRSGKTLYNVRLDRYADFDIDNTVKFDIFHKSPRAVFGVDQATSTNVVSMTELTAATYTTAIHAWSQWQKNVCNQSTEVSPTAPEDWVGRISYDFGTLAKGASKTVKVQYRLQ